LDGEGIRYEIVSFLKMILSGKQRSYIDYIVSKAIITETEHFYSKTNFVEI